MPNSDSTLVVERFDSIVRLTLNRPEKRNALDDALHEQLSAALHEADLDEDVRVIILAGAGPSFCSGDDLEADNPLREAGGRPSDAPELKTQRTGPEAMFAREQYLYYDKALALRNLRTPTIAAVQGWAIAAGLMIVCMCDLIVAAEDAKFRNPVVRQTNLGVELLVEPWDMGIRQAKEFLWTGDLMTAEDAYRLGMVNKVVPNEDLQEEALRMARRIALSPPVTVQLLKRSLNQTQDLMGQRQSFEYHFAIHQFAHWTHESDAYAAELAESGLSARDYVKRRDARYEES